MKTRKRTSLGLGALALGCACALSGSAHADPLLRKQVDQRGDFVLFGNTVAFECAQGGNPAVPPPVVGTIGDCPDSNLTAPDVFFRSDAPANGQAQANSMITTADARSTAMLVLPQDAKVSYARLYWGALYDGSGPDMSVRVERPASGLNQSVTADATNRLNQGAGGTPFWYQSSADVTALVQQQGAGAYRVGDIGSVNIVNLASLYPFVAWYMVVFYEKDDDPIRNLALFDGMDLIQAGSPKTVQLSGFLVPNSGFDAKLGVVAVEGDPLLPGDAMAFNNNTVSDAQNPADNFFNASRGFLGAAVSNVGDLPQLTGGPRSMSGVDMDVVDVENFVSAGQSSATIAATTALDTYILTAFVTSISTLKPDFRGSSKKARDVNGGRLLPGDELEYELSIHNRGSDASIETILRDKLPDGVTFVAGSLEIVSGPNMGKKTDAADTDQGEYDSANRTVVVRLGSAGTGSSGGSIAVNDTSVVRFRVKVDAATRGKVANQGVITAKGQRGAPSEDTKTDGNGDDDGEPTTDVTVDECASDMDCKAPKGLCDTSQSPQVCVECVTSADCKDLNAPDCNTMTHTCECTMNMMGCKDTDGDGISDGGETDLGTDPNDADTDDDGTPDGAELAPDKDIDGDGVINALDADSDNDGLFDGTEQGLDCEGKGTDKTRMRCRPDADRGATKTNPTKKDTDGGGVSDGSEDSNLNGSVDSGESDPTEGHPSDDPTPDTDGDGLSDRTEKVLRTNPMDADSDDDGVVDGDEANPSEDTDLDGRNNVLDVDSDDDALLDGTESGQHCAQPATDTSRGHCIPDADMGKTKTSPLLADTDKGSVRDGSEDLNRNGLLETGELDPTAGHGADDKNAIDTDRDGLSDGLERNIGTNPNDADSDDDGARDGQEPNPADDQDGDGKINALDPDSDDDKLWDGTELGLGCSDPATALNVMLCIADADSGATKTSALNPDTDEGGKKDGDEDFNKNGRRDTNELNPLDPSDDNTPDVCDTDADCGDASSGRICVDNRCVPGCRGAMGNNCMAGQVCTSMDDKPGMCMPASTDAGVYPPGKLEGGGCDCSLARPGRQREAWGGLVLGLLIAGALLRRRRSRGP